MEKASEINDAGFSMRCVPAARRIEIELRGFWDLETIGRFQRAYQEIDAVLAASGCRLGDHVALIDNSAFQVQRQEIVEAMERMVAGIPRPALRTAAVVNSALLRLQAERVGPGHVLFRDRSAALHWLSEPGD